MRVWKPANFLPLPPSALAASQSAIVTGQLVSLTANVPVNDAGNMQFYDNGATLGSSVSVHATSSTKALQITGWGGFSTSLTLPDSAFTETGLTISGWVRINGSTGGGSLLAGFDGSGGGFWAGLSYNYGGDWYLQVGDGALDTGVRTDDSGGWHHVAAVFDPEDSQVVFYYDGVARFTGPAPEFSSGGSGTLTIGYDAYGGGVQAVSGSIAELDVWDTALGSDDINQVWNGGLALTSSTLSDYPSPDNLVAGYHFNDNADDFTGNGNNGTIWSADGIDADSGISWPTGVPNANTATLTTNPADSGPDELTTPGLHTITATFTSDGSDVTIDSAPVPVVVEDTTLPGDGAVTNVAPNQSTPSPVTDGSLVQSVAFTAGSLNYVSNSVGNATVGADASFEETDYSYVLATLTLKQDGSSVASNSVYYSAQGMTSDTSYRFTVPISGRNLATGC